MDVSSDDARFGLGYALAAYAVIFVAFFAYLAWLHVSHRRLRRRLDALDALVDARAGGVGADRPGAGQKSF